jgi:hypothetical protein
MSVANANKEKDEVDLLFDVAATFACLFTFFLIKQKAKRNSARSQMGMGSNSELFDI